MYEPNGNQDNTSQSVIVQNSSVLHQLCEYIQNKLISGLSCSYQGYLAPDNYFPSSWIAAYWLP